LHYKRRSLYYKEITQTQTDTREYDYSALDIEPFIRAAIEKQDTDYPNYWTTLHPAIFYCIKKGFTKIYLAGCNNTPGKIKDASEPLNLAYMKRHTDRIINVAKKHSIQIIQLNDYKHFANFFI